MPNRNSKLRMARAYSRELVDELRTRFGLRGAAAGASIAAEHVPQRLPLTKTAEGGAVIFVAPEVVERLGWRDGGLIYLREIGRADVRASSGSLLVEVE